MKAIQTTLVNEFKKNHNDTDFPARAYKQIAEFKGKIGAENKNDPNRLNVRGKYMSQLKMLCIASLARHQVDEHYDADMDKVEKAYTSAADRKIAREFDELKMLEQYTQQRKWSKTKEDGIAGELATVRVIPQILEQLKLTKREAWTARDNTQARMLEHEKIEVDVDAMMAAVLPDLHSAVIPKLALALLLTTGRRTVEIFKTAVFTKVAKYRVLFAGQVKTFNDKPYEIDLLAEADVVIKALADLRGLADCTTMDNVQTHSTYGKMMTREVDKLHKQLALGEKTPLTPHTLRAIHGSACSVLYKPKNVKELTYLHGLLGHDSASSTNHYQYVDATVTMPFVETKEETKGDSKREPVVKDESFGLTSTGSLPHIKRVDAIAAMMKERKFGLSVTSIKQHTGGRREVIKEIMAWGNNKAIIDAYNAGL